MIYIYTNDAAPFPQPVAKGRNLQIEDSETLLWSYDPITGKLVLYTNEDCC